MADPLSIAGVALAVATAALQSVKILSEFINSIEDCPKEISGLSRDLRAFEAVVASLETALASQEMRDIVGQNGTLETMVGNLKGPFANCSMTADELKSQIQLFVRKSGDAGGYRFKTRGTARWAALGGKKHVNEIADRLMRDKMTLDNSMNAICTYCNIRSGGARMEPTKHSRRRSMDTDAGFAMRKYLEVLSNAGSPPDSPDLHSTMGPQASNEVVPDITPSEAFKALDFKEQLKEREHQRQELFQAAESGDNISAQILLIEGTEVNGKALDGKTPLHVAAEFGNEEVASTLLRYGADVHAKTNSRGTPHERKFRGGRIPLHWAAAAGHENIIQILLDHGSDVAAASITQRRPLQEATMQGHTSCAKLLIENGTPVNAQDDEGFGALHEAANHGRYDIAKMLLDHGADIEMMTEFSDHGNDAKGRLGRRTPLLLAAQGHHLHLIQLLVSRGANIHARNNSGEMAIHLAAWFGHISVVRATLDAGADIEAKDFLCDETPIHKAAANGHTTVVKLLLQKGARIDHINHLGRDVLEHARLHRPGNDETVAVLSEHIVKLNNQATAGDKTP